MKSTKRTNIILIINITTFLSAAFLLTLHTVKTTNLYFTNSLIPSKMLCDKSITPHLSRMIEGLNTTTTTRNTDYLIEDDCEIADPFIQNPIVVPEVLELDDVIS